MFSEVTQDRKGLRPKRDLVSVMKEAPAIQIQDIPIELQPFCPYLSRKSRDR